MAEGVARDVDAVAAQEDVFGAVVWAVVAIFGGGDVGDEAGVGSEAQRGRGGGLDGGIAATPGRCELRQASPRLDEGLDKTMRWMN